MSALEAKIDDLYKEPLNGFVAARTALAKTLQGDQAKRVKQLQKPTVVPWAVNQVFWHSRPIYDRLVSTGQKLRTTQLEALKGRTADVRRATDAHRAAMAAAVAEAMRLAEAAGSHPSADELSKTLEAISLTPDPPETHGRLTKPLRPAGFEALSGVPIKALPRSVPTATAAKAPANIPASARAAKPPEDTRAAERAREAAERRKAKAIEHATASVVRAKAAEAKARAAWERAKRELASAELTLSAQKSS